METCNITRQISSRSCRQRIDVCTGQVPSLPPQRWPAREIQGMTTSWPSYFGWVVRPCIMRSHLGVLYKPNVPMLASQHYVVISTSNDLHSDIVHLARGSIDRTLGIQEKLCVVYRFCVWFSAWRQSAKNIGMREKSYLVRAKVKMLVCCIFKHVIYVLARRIYPPILHKHPCIIVMACSFCCLQSVLRK